MIWQVETATVPYPPVLTLTTTLNIMRTGLFKVVRCMITIDLLL